MARAVYKAKDDSEHKTEKDAARRDALVEANERLESACKEVSKLLAGAALTGDGKPFDTSRSARYWVVHHRHGFVPSFREVYLYPYNLSVDFDRTDNALVLREWQQGDNGRDGRYVEWKVGELYTEEKAARAAMVEACKEWVEEQVRVIEAMEEGRV